MSEFPHGWSTREIEEICDIHDYRRIPLSSEERRERKGPYPYYGANNIQGHIDDFIFDFDAVLIAEDGGYYDEHEYRDIAQYATGKYWVNNHAHILTGKPGLDTRFLYYALVRKNICPWINTGTRSKLNQSDLKRIELLVPPLPEQKKIAEILSGIDTTITSIKTARARLVLLKKSLSLKLFANTSDQGKQATFGDVCIKIQDGTHFSPQSKDGERLYITSRNIRPGRLDLSSTAWISIDEHTEIYKRCPVKKGDVLLTKDGANTGNACLNTLDDEFSLLSSVAFIRPEPNQCDPNYMLQWIMSDMFQSEIQQGMSGNAIARLTLTKINNLPIYLPSLEKQKEIAGILLGIDNQCKSYSSKADSLQGLKSAISSDLLSGRQRVSI
jgi:type I restriction enzyme S subunit